MTEEISLTSGPSAADLAKADLLDAFAEGGSAFAHAVGLVPDPDAEPAFTRIVAAVDCAIAGPVAAARVAHASVERSVHLTTGVLDRLFHEPFREAERLAASKPKAPPRPHLFTGENRNG